MNWNQIIQEIQWLIPTKISLLDIIQALLLSLIIFYLCRTLYQTRGWILAKGLISIGLIYLFLYSTNMTILTSIMDNLFSIVLIAIIIMLQPELQKIVENFGSRDWKNTFSSIIKKQKIKKSYLSEHVISEIAIACQEMKEAKTGALIVIERKIPLKDFCESGIPIKAEISSQLLINTFEKNTPLHDGAVVIKENKLDSATCYLPLTHDSTVNKHLGTRHRAAIGASESTDCIVVIVSEETGAISVSVDGKIKYDINKVELINELMQLSQIDTDVSVQRKQHHTPLWLKIASLIAGITVSLTILNNADPIVTKRIDNIPVQLVNESILDELNQLYTVESGSVVSVEIEGKQSIVDEITVDSFIATADISEMSMVYAIPIRVETKYSNVNIKTNNDVLKLKLEKIGQIEIPVEINQIGGNDQYLVQSLTARDKTVMISGAESLIRTLDKAVIEIDVSNETKNFMRKVDLVFYDKNGDEVSKDKISAKTSSTIISGIVYKTKEVEVGIQLKEQDLNASSYYVLNDVQLEYPTIKVAAAQDILDTLSRLDFVITPDQTMTEASSLTLKLQSYLPDDIYMANNQTPEISMAIDIDKFDKCSIPLSKNNISISGLNEETHTINIVTMPSTLDMYVNTSVVNANELNINLFAPQLIIGEIEGESTLNLILKTVQGTRVISDLNVTVDVQRKAVTQNDSQ